MNRHRCHGLSLDFLSPMSAGQSSVAYRPMVHNGPMILKGFAMFCSTVQNRMAVAPVSPVKTNGVKTLCVASFRFCL